MQSQHTVLLDKKGTAQQLRHCSCPKHRDGKQKWVYLLLVDRDIVDFGRFAGQRNCFGIADRGYRRTNVINLKRLLNGKQNVWKYQNGEEKSDSDGREKDV